MGVSIAAMEIGFQFRVIWKDEDMFQLSVSAWNGAFAGVAEVYEGIGQLDEIADHLRGFPANPSDVREVVFGSLEEKYAGGGVSMRFHCVDGAGHTYVESRIDSKTVMGGTSQSVTLAMSVEATAVDSFISELRRLEKVGSGLAHLRGINQHSR
jgi:hypothetical protein